MQSETVCNGAHLSCRSTEFVSRMLCMIYSFTLTMTSALHCLGSEVLICQRQRGRAADEDVVSSIASKMVFLSLLHQAHNHLDKSQS